jgi:protein-disulfide isomerase
MKHDREFGAGARLDLPLTPERDHVRGRVDAPVVIVEYGDYESEPCRGGHRAVERLREAFDGTLGFAFRHFPLTTIHPNALLAAEAAEAAGRQGRFWEMHDALLRRAVDPRAILGLAEDLYLDMDEFRSAIGAGAARGRIREDRVSGIRSGVDSTPTFFVNGQMWPGIPEPRDVELLLRRR